MPCKPLIKKGCIPVGRVVNRLIAARERLPDPGLGMKWVAAKSRKCKGAYDWRRVRVGRVGGRNAPVVGPPAVRRRPAPIAPPRGGGNPPGQPPAPRPPRPPRPPRGGGGDGGRGAANPRGPAPAAPPRPGRGGGIRATGNAMDVDVADASLPPAVVAPIGPRIHPIFGHEMNASEIAYVDANNIVQRLPGRNAFGGPMSQLDGISSEYAEARSRFSEMPVREQLIQRRNDFSGARYGSLRQEENHEQAFELMNRRSGAEIGSLDYQAVNYSPPFLYRDAYGFDPALQILADANRDYHDHLMISDAINQIPSVRAQGELAAQEREEHLDRERDLSRFRARTAGFSPADIDYVSLMNSVLDPEDHVTLYGENPPNLIPRRLMPQRLQNIANAVDAVAIAADPNSVILNPAIAPHAPSESAFAEARARIDQRRANAANAALLRRQQYSQLAIASAPPASIPAAIAAPSAPSAPPAGRRAGRVQSANSNSNNDAMSDALIAQFQPPVSPPAPPPSQGRSRPRFIRQAEPEPEPEVQQALLIEASEAPGSEMILFQPQNDRRNGIPTRTINAVRDRLSTMRPQIGHTRNLATRTSEQVSRVQWQRDRIQERRRPIPSRMYNNVAFPPGDFDFGISDQTRNAILTRNEDRVGARLSYASSRSRRTDEQLVSVLNRREEAANRRRRPPRAEDLVVAIRRDPQRVPQRAPLPNRTDAAADFAAYMMSVYNETVNFQRERQNPRGTRVPRNRRLGYRPIIEEE